MQRHFTIVIPAYNCEPWVEKNLKSAINQDYSNYDVVYIDDASTDSTLDRAKAVLASSSTSYSLIKNEVNRKALPNLYDAVYQSQEGTIIVALDGDDWLLNNNVLTYLNEVYDQHDPWITAGSYIDNYQGIIHRPKVDNHFWQGIIRQKEWSLSHLRTFRRELFTKIELKDFLDLDGSFFKYTWDRVIMYPMVEMAGQQKFHAILKPLYVYNRLNPISVDRVHRKDQLRIEQLISRKETYQKVEEL